ncbi:MAG: PQQ-binding-like beta-propeller repeat protein [Myxococcota bacterium]|nr:PQQ-binding-like beta-propeller repeat protein [Myxococcota bacterium]
MRRAVTAAMLLSSLASCGGRQTRLKVFSTDWEDDRGASIARVWDRLSGAAVPPAADVVVGIAAGGDKLIGMPLSSDARDATNATSARWVFSHALDARPVVAGNVLVGSGGDECFALDAKTGNLLWRRATGGNALLGAGDDGTVTVASFRRAGGTGSVLLAVAHDGQLVRQIETEKAIGAPAVLGRMAFVPWAGQYVSVIDLTNGNEAARVTLREQSSRAWTQGGALWFGELGFIRFDAQIRDASRGGASMVTPPARALPGMPKLMPSGNSPVAPIANAEDKTRLYARPEAADEGGDERVALGDRRFYATYFRVAMAFEAGASTSRRASVRAVSGPAGKLGWVHVHDADFVGGAAAHGGMVLCDEKGKITELDARTGAVLSQDDLGEPVKACVVNIDDARVAGTPRETKPLAAQLAEAVAVDDPQLVAAQRLLLRELTAMSDEIATKTLVDLASDPRTSPDLLADARKALANRRNGATYMEAALERHYDFLKDVLRPPPVGPIAQALGAMNSKTAAPLLAAHLLDPADSDEDVMQAAAALLIVGGANEVPALRQFFGMYRATADTDDVATAVVDVGQALISLDPKASRSAVEAAAADPGTVPYARERLQAMLDSQPTPPAVAPPAEKHPHSTK